MSWMGAGSGPTRVWITGWSDKKDWREELEGKWPLKLSDSPSVIWISLAIEGGSTAGRAKMSKANSDLLPSEAKRMLALLGDSSATAAHNKGNRKLSQKQRLGLVFIVTVDSTEAW
jgi:hypothetical protein